MSKRCMICGEEIEDVQAWHGDHATTMHKSGRDDHNPLTLGGMVLRGLIWALVLYVAATLLFGIVAH